MKIKRPWDLIFSILVCQLAGVVGSRFTMSAIPTWYETLIKPSFSPPPWIFGPVWLTLYTLMGISLYRVWIKVKNPSKNPAIILFIIQLILNALWSIIFFGQKNLGLALTEIIILFAAVCATTYKFYKIDKLAGRLLLPYLLWVAFAGFLNFSLWRLNY